MLDAVFFSAKIESIQDARAAMHPVNFLFDEIMRKYWGIHPVPERPERQRRERPFWRLPRRRGGNEKR
ncbi:hypothetical protein [Mesorhizobium marinum]|uniref:Uncharacterized protein n=1 Tax=Mesorhizobium marinum TaxID=3228790 RepID=A0ABV3R583_9HYPH